MLVMKMGQQWDPVPMWTMPAMRGAETAKGVLLLKVTYFLHVKDNFRGETVTFAIASTMINKWLF